MNRCINEYINNVSKASDEQNAKRYRLFCTLFFNIIIYSVQPARHTKK